MSKNISWHKWIFQSRFKSYKKIISLPILFAVELAMAKSAYTHNNTYLQICILLYLILPTLLSLGKPIIKVKFLLDVSNNFIVFFDSLQTIAYLYVNVILYILLYAMILSLIYHHMFVGYVAFFTLYIFKIFFIWTIHFIAKY